MALGETTESPPTTRPPLTRLRRPDYLYWSYFLLGSGFLTPWNALMSAIDYFDDIYPEREALRWISVCFYGTAFITILINSLVPPKDRGHTRVSIGLSLFIVTILLIPVMDYALVREGKESDTSFAVLLGLIVFIGIGHALNEGCSFGMAIFLPIEYNLGYVRGTGLCGLISVFLRIMLKAAFTNSTDGLRTSARVFFLFTSLYCVICLVAQRCVIVPHSIFLQETQGDDAPSLPLLQSAESENSNSIWAKIRESSWMQAVWKIRVNGLHLFLVFLAAYTIVPGVPSDAESSTLGDWYSVMLIGIYSFGNYIARQLPPGWTLKSHKVVTISLLLRILLVPIAFVITQYTYNPFIISLLILVVGLTQGYFSMCVFAMGQHKMQGGDDAFVGGNVLAFALALGICFGGSASILWTKID